VKKWSCPLSEREEGIQNNRKYWHPSGEAVVLFREHTAICFEDLIYADEHNLETLDVSRMMISCEKTKGLEKDKNNNLSFVNQASLSWKHLSKNAKKLGRTKSSFFPAPVALNHGGRGPPQLTHCDAKQLLWLTIASNLASCIPPLLGASSSSPGMKVDNVYIHKTKVSAVVRLDPVLLTSEVRTTEK
jgi:hypothetical protein